MGDQEIKDIINSYPKCWIKIGNPVVHRTNLNFQYTVKSIKKRSVEIETDKVNSDYEKNGKYYQKRIFIEGVECAFVNRFQEKDIEIFHTKELVPYEVAKLGLKAVNDFYNRL